MAERPGLLSRVLNFRRWRVSSKIAFGVVSLTLVVFMIVFSIFGVFSSRNIEAQMQENLLFQTQTVATEIDRNLLERQSNLLELVQRGNAPKIANLINSFSKDERRTLYNQSANGKTLNLSSASYDMTQLMQWENTMRTISELYGYSKAVLTASNGDIVISSEPIIDYPLQRFEEEIKHGGKTSNEKLPEPGMIKALSTDVLDNVSDTEWFMRARKRTTEYSKSKNYEDKISMTVVKNDPNGQTWSVVVSAPIVGDVNNSGFVSFWFPVSSLGKPIDLVNKENPAINGAVVYIPYEPNEYEVDGEKELRYEALLLHHSIGGIVGWSIGSIYYLRPDEYDEEGKIRLQSEFDKDKYEHPDIPWTIYHYEFTKKYVYDYLEEVHHIREQEGKTEEEVLADIQAKIKETALTYDVSGRGIPQLYVNYDITHTGNQVLANQGIEMFAYLRITRSSYRAPINQIIILSIITTLFAMILLVLLFILIIQRLMNPLLVLRGGIQEVSFGNYDIEVPVETEDEIGDLAKTFNQMIQDIRGYVQTEADREQQDNTIAQLLDTMSSASGGDLTVQAEVTADILGGVSDSLNYLVAQLKEVISGVINVSTSIGENSQETLQSTEKLSNESQKQLELITDTSSAVSIIAQSTEDASSLAGNAADSARHSAEIAETGGKTVAEAVEGMNQIRGSVAEISKRIKKLGESSQEIGEIVDVISDIAEQTNMLALNAAIEAARAGEQGKGFSVVADAVRQLAERSAKATKDIALLIRGIQAETAETVEVMEESTRLVVEGSRSAETARQTLEQIVESSRILAETISGVSESSKQQSEATQDINRSMGEISTITQDTTDGVLNVAEALAQIAVLAGELQELVSRFRI